MAIDNSAFSVSQDPDEGVGYLHFRPVLGAIDKKLWGWPQGLPLHLLRIMLFVAMAVAAVVTALRIAFVETLASSGSSFGRVVDSCG